MAAVSAKGAVKCSQCLCLCQFTGEEGCIKKVPLLFSYHEGKEDNQTGFLSNNYSGQPKLLNYSNHNKSVNFIGLLPKFKPNLLLHTCRGFLTLVN